MRIDFECSGGFANLKLSFHGDTADLPPEVGAELQRLIQESRIRELRPKDTRADQGAPDAMTYRVKLSNGETQTLVLNDVNAPAAVHPLLARLRALALDQARESR